MKNHNLALPHGNLFCYVIFFPLLMALYACPYSSPYKLDKYAPLPVEDNLLGKWATMVTDNTGNEFPVKMILTRKSDTEYFIDFTGDFEDLQHYGISKDDTIKGFAYSSIVADLQFLNIEIKGLTYIATLKHKNNRLSLSAISDGFTAKYIKSDEDLKKAIEAHVRTRVFPHYDDQFSLIEMVKVN